jgi:hypothetical protein
MKMIQKTTKMMMKMTLKIVKTPKIQKIVKTLKILRTVKTLKILKTVKTLKILRIARILKIIPKTMKMRKKMKKLKMMKYDVKPTGSDGTVIITPPFGAPFVFNPTGTTVKIDNIEIQSFAARPITGMPSLAWANKG